jgi:hypothetical protein
LKAGPLGQFKLPVTITPTSNTIFFIDPEKGNDNLPGTAARPWASVAKALTGTATTGSRVALVASAGNDVVVTILSGSTEAGITDNISTPNLPAGSVTVLKAPSAGTFTLNMGSKQLTLNKGYKLQDIKIDFDFGGGNAATTAVTIAHPTAGLASVEVTCSNGSNVKCVEVQGSGSHTLKNVTVKVEARSGNVGIKNNTGANLSIVGGEVRLIETSSSAAITLINAQGVLIATGLTVDMTGGITLSGISLHTQSSKGIVLNAAGSLVTNSTIKVNNGPGSGSNAIGINVRAVSTVKNTTFFGYGNSIGIVGGSNLSSDSGNNAFSGNFASGGPVQ